MRSCKTGIWLFRPWRTVTWLALMHGKDKRIQTDDYETDNLVRKASFCPTSKLIRTFNAHPRRRHRLSRIDHASFIFFFIWRWLSGPCVYPSSRTIGSGRKLRGGCAHIGSWARVFLFDKRGLGNEQPNQDHAVGLAMAHCSSFLSATLDSDLLGLPSGGTPITYALHTFWRCVFATHPVC